MTTKQTRSFETEVKQLLHLMIHSLYSNKEIFLRELVSNASDALDKLRFAALSDNALYENDPELKIQLQFDKAAGTLTISDNGIGMNEAEVIENIGTIAKSGTKQFLEAMAQDKRQDASLIGQFGVGFYSAFIVAKKVVLETRKTGTAVETGVRWESSGEGEYAIETLPREKHGTSVTLFLKDDEKELADEWKIRDIVHKYSEHIPYPITMEVPVDADKPDSGTKFDTLNSAKALWARGKAEVKPEEYDDFYKQIAHDMEVPLTHVHSRIEGNLEYTLLFFIPKNLPFDMMFNEQRRGVRLYVKRVFIMDDADKLLPKYLRFVRGVIDSADLPLNVSREILQENRILEAIKSSAVKKILGLIEDLAANETEKFATFWKTFGSIFKEGIIEDPANAERIAAILRFSTTVTDKPEQTLTLDQYIERMKLHQEKIYFIIADSFTAARGSAQIEAFRKKGIEVLLLSDRVDHWVMSHLTEYKGKKFANIARGDVDLSVFADDAEKEELKKAEGDYKDLIKKIQDLLQDKIKEVRVSQRLTQSPACLVADGFDMDTRLKRVLEQAGQKVPSSKPVLEINPTHFIVRRLNREDDKRKFEDWARLMYDQAVLGDGGQLEDPAAFVGRLNDLLLTLSLT